MGNELKLLLGDKAIYVDRDELDITDAKAVEQFFKANTFESVINCAAYTAVDKAEVDADMAVKINVDGPKYLAMSGVPMIQVSTDYVFDGKGHQPYVESDEANPESVYGVTKLDGEKAVLEHASGAFVIRTAWLYSAYGNNFVKTMQRLGSERESLNVVFDQIGTPTYARDLAQAIMAALPKLKKGVKEVYHFSNEGVCSWYDFAVEIMKISGLKCKVSPIESKDYPTPAKRPFYSVLNKAKIKKDLGIDISHWTVSLKDCVEKLKNGI